MLRVIASTEADSIIHSLAAAGKHVTWINCDHFYISRHIVRQADSVMLEIYALPHCSQS